MSDLRGSEQHRRAVGAGRDAGTTADAGRRVERTVGISFGHGSGVRIGSGAVVGATALVFKDVPRDCIINASDTDPITS